MLLMACSPQLSCRLRHRLLSDSSPAEHEHVTLLTCPLPWHLFSPSPSERRVTREVPQLSPRDSVGLFESSIWPWRQAGLCATQDGSFEFRLRLSRLLWSRPPGSPGTHRLRILQDS